MIICRHVLFNEQEFPCAKIHSPSPTTYDYLCSGLHPSLLQHLHASKNVPSTIQYTPTIQSIAPIPYATNTTSYPSTPTFPTINHSSNPTSPSLLAPKIITRITHGIYKPNPKYQQSHHTISISPLPKNLVSALNDPH